VRGVLNDVERECIVKHGYGLHSFEHALADTFERLSAEPVTPELHAQVTRFAHSVADHPVELLPQVPETLQYLADRHHLILVTKGAIVEQTGKIERSGLKYELTHDSTWMIGNSPKSDINPALATGLNAVFIPHGDTWVLEHAEVDTATPPQRLLTVQRFADLSQHF
jgi:putative hydrolase of the HAD superfamily